MRVSVCHCLDCQRRSGSAFAVQARWPDARVVFAGVWREWSGSGDGGAVATFRFCGACGATIAFNNHNAPGTTAIPVGAFADPGLPPPTVSVYEDREHPWVAIVGDGVEHWE